MKSKLELHKRRLLKSQPYLKEVKDGPMLWPPYTPTGEHSCCHIGLLADYSGREYLVDKEESSPVSIFIFGSQILFEILQILDP